jgi:hypothetical protein
MHTFHDYDDAPLGVEALTVFGMTGVDADPMQWSPSADFGITPEAEPDEWDTGFEREELRALGRVLGFDC